MEARATQPIRARALLLGARAGGAVSCCSSSSAGSILVVLGSPFCVDAEMAQPGKTGETLAWMEAAGPAPGPDAYELAHDRPPARPPLVRAPEALGARRHAPRGAMIPFPRQAQTPRPAPRRRGYLYVQRPHNTS